MKITSVSMSIYVYIFKQCLCDESCLNVKTDEDKFYCSYRFTVGQ